MNSMWYRQFWPWFIFSLPAIVVVASIGSMVIAFKFQDPVILDHWYQEGENVNNFLTQDRNAKNLQLKPSINYDKVTGVFSIKIQATNRLSVKELDLLLEHPLDRKLDNQIKLLPVSNSKYEGFLPKDLTGVRYVMITPVDNSWRLVGRFDFSKNSYQALTDEHR